MLKELLAIETAGLSPCGKRFPYGAICALVKQWNREDAAAQYYALE